MALVRTFGKDRHEIVVPTDFSPRSAAALAFARSIAGAEARVTAVHAIDPLQYQFGPLGASDMRKNEERDSAKHSIAEWLKQSEFSRGVETTLIEGEPGPAISQFAAARSAEFVVLATSARQHA